MSSERTNVYSYELSQPAATAGDAADRLTKLPSELLHMILDYLLPQHHPNRTIWHPRGYKSKYPHALDAVAETSKLLRVEVNDWATHSLLRFRGVNSEQQLKGKRRDKAFNALRGRNGLLDWISTHCIFCGKKTRRYAILMNGFHCCKECDRREWPNKVTQSNALNEYDLKKHHLLPDTCADTAQLKELQEKFPLGVPRIRYGSYALYGMATTMFLREDVEWLAEQYHPNLDAHLAKRKATKLERARKREEKAQTAART